MPLDSLAAVARCRASRDKRAVSAPTQGASTAVTQGTLGTDMYALSDPDPTVVYFTDSSIADRERGRERPRSDASGKPQSGY